MKAKIFINESGKACMQMTLGKHTLIEEMPDRLAGYSAEELQAHFNSVVPGMAKKLLGMQRKHERKFRKKAQCGNRRKSEGSVKGKSLSERLLAETLSLPQ